MSNTARRKYDKTFKEEAVRLVIEGEKPLAQVARDLGIHENLLGYWKKKYLEDPANSFCSIPLYLTVRSFRFPIYL
jgi:transposase-like protein